MIEKYIAPNPKVSRKLVFFLIVLNMAYILLFPMWCAHFAEIHPLLRAVYFMISSIGFLKLLSYHHIWHDIRYHVILANKPVLESKNDLKNEDSKSNDDVKVKSTPKNSEDLKILAVDPTLTADCLMKKLNLPKHTIDDIMKYPNNVKAWDLIVFNFAPTLNFQLAFPFSNNPSLFKFAFGIFKYLILLGLWVTIVLEYCLPLTEECVHSIKQENYYDAAYHFIRMAAPNTYAWLVLFYGTFHVYLNAFADLTGFSDKNFYEDWWNSKTFGEYWRKWNLPVHNWLTRHIYYPLIRRKYGRTLSMLIVFFFSAVMHEYIMIG